MKNGVHAGQACVMHEHDAVHELRSERMMGKNDVVCARMCGVRESLQIGNKGLVLRPSNICCFITPALLKRCRRQ